MTTAVVPFLLAMFVGRTIDLKTYTIGGDIFDGNEYEETPRYVLNSTYTILQENVFPYSDVGFPIDIVLRIKSDVLQSALGPFGLDGLLKKTSWKSNSVVIVVTSEVQTVHREIKEDSPLLDNWESRLHSNQTHYVHSALFGGWSVILYQLKCQHSGQEEEVRKFFTSIMGVSGQMDDKAVDLWQSALTALNQQEDLKDNVQAKVLTYSTVSLSEEVTSPESILRAIKKFPVDVGETGKPMFAELKPLHDLNSKFPVVRPHNDLKEYFLEVDKMFDDLRSMTAAMRKWVSGSEKEFTDDEEERISNLFEHLSGCTKLFRSIASEASFYKPMDMALYQSAVALYMNGLENGATSYRELLLRLIEDIDPDCGDDFNEKITGTLQVEDDERIEAGEMRDALDECKSLCLRDTKCRSIQYNERMESDSAVMNNRSTFKSNQCWLQFRSSRTAELVTQEHIQSGVYDRKCFNMELN